MNFFRQVLVFCLVFVFLVFFVFVLLRQNVEPPLLMLFNFNYWLNFKSPKWTHVFIECYYLLHVELFGKNLVINYCFLPSDRLFKKSLENHCWKNRSSTLGCSVKRFSQKFRKIHRKTPLSDLCLGSLSFRPQASSFA